MSRRHLVLGCLAIPLLLTLAGAPPAAATRSHHTDYVALGDSYSAGVGAPGQVGLCLRSPNGYPGQWAGRQPPPVVHQPGLRRRHHRRRAAASQVPLLPAAPT